MAPSTLRPADKASRRIPRRVAFTVAVLDSASCPAETDRIWIYDTRQAGLCMMITNSGAKAFYVYRKVLGRPQRVRLGAFPDISIEQGRKLTQRTIGEISSGRDPMADRRAAKAKGMNMGDLWGWFLASWAKPRKRSWVADKSRYETHLKSWEQRRLTDITRSEVAALHQRVAVTSSNTTANRVLALLASVSRR